MSEFLRTGIGRKLLEKDIPKLTSVLERIADQLERSNKLEEKKFILEEKIQKLTLKESNIKSQRPNNLLGL
jgi:vacuolar-type H+-ATPase subunit I/STV1|tara:strand:- start:320 stop:532 length:213 start_codon:yes stop_codon:yes gene_type:complete